MSLINEFKLDSNISSSSSCSIFCHVLLKFLLHVGRKIFIINDTLGTKMLTRLRLSFIYLCDHKFRHGLRDKLNPLCSCSVETEITTQYSQRCYFFNVNRDNALHKNQVFHYGFLQKCNQIRRKLRIWSNLLNKSFMKNFIFYAVMTMNDLENIPASFQPNSFTSLWPSHEELRKTNANYKIH